MDIANVKMSMNPFDEIAVEEAVRLKENVATEVIAVSCGVTQCQETLRTAMAIGADRAILVETDAELQPLAVAKLLTGAGRQGEAGPRDPGQAGHRRRLQPDRADARRAGRLVAGDVRLRSVSGDTANVTREVDGGSRRCAIGLPAVVTTDLRLNEPRYVTLPNIMKAKKKPLDTKSSLPTWASTSRPHQDAQGHRAPKRSAGIKVPTSRRWSPNSRTKPR